VTDFGFSKIYSNGEQLKTKCGTPDYIAPELISTSDTPYSNSVDMWAVGVICYELLCGYSPFQADNQNDLFRAILKCVVEFPDAEWRDISREAKDFVKRLLVKDPSQRMTAEEALKHEWLSGNASKEALKDSFKNHLHNSNIKRRASKTKI
jgi:calcium/calmodulin-dependent protein kinase I